MKHWRIFLAGVRFGQMSGVRLERGMAEQLIASLGITDEQVSRWLADWKRNWGQH